MRSDYLVIRKYALYYYILLLLVKCHKRERLKRTKLLELLLWNQNVVVHKNVGWNVHHIVQLIKCKRNVFLLIINRRKALSQKPYVLGVISA